MRAGNVIGLYGPGGEDIVVAQAWAQRFAHAMIKRGEDVKHYYSLHSQVQEGTITIHLLDTYPVSCDGYDLVYVITHRTSGGLLPTLIYSAWR